MYVSNMSAMFSLLLLSAHSIEMTPLSDDKTKNPKPISKLIHYESAVGSEWSFHTFPDLGRTEEKKRERKEK